VRRHAPERLLTREPNPIHDIVGETALCFDALGDHKVLEFVAAPGAHRLVAGAVAVAPEIEKEAGGQDVPRGLKLLFGGSQNRGARVCGDAIPRGALGGRWVRMESGAWDERVGN